MFGFGLLAWIKGFSFVKVSRRTAAGYWMTTSLESTEFKSMLAIYAWLSA